MSSFTLKRMEIRLTLASKSFGQGNTKIITELAMEAGIQKPGLPDFNKANIKIWGMKYEDMAELSTLAFRPLENRGNFVSILAGDDETGLSRVFSGEITSAHADFGSAPDVVFVVEATTGSYPIQMAAAPVCVHGAAPAADMIAQQAKQMGYEFRNEGVSDSVQNCNFDGSPLEKATAVAKHVGAELLVDDKQLVLMRPDKPRSGQAVYLSPETGLIGYPAFTNDGISLKALFNPNFQQGGQIRVQSIVPKASGNWKITKLTHNLSAYNPQGGPWESRIEATYI